MLRCRHFDVVRNLKTVVSKHAREGGNFKLTIRRSNRNDRGQGPDLTSFHREKLMGPNPEFAMNDPCTGKLPQPPR